jgi:hypothetical protein
MPDIDQGDNPDFPPPPTPGRIVDYHHGEDDRWWPSIVLEVNTTPGYTPTSSERIVNDDGEAIMVPAAPVPAESVCYLQVFRPRGNEWRRCTEGVNPGQWRWPIRD